MTDVYIKKYWEEEKTLIYLHFRGGFAIRQIEITPSITIYLDEENPRKGESTLSDQPINILEYNQEDIISQQEFELKWSKNDNIY